MANSLDMTWRSRGRTDTRYWPFAQRRCLPAAGVLYRRLFSTGDGGVLVVEPELPRCRSGHRRMPPTCGGTVSHNAAQAKPANLALCIFRASRLNTGLLHLPVSDGAPPLARIIVTC